MSFINDREAEITQLRQEEKERTKLVEFDSIQEMKSYLT
jgi:hypothetical protein